ncbi:MAG: hypothetical protein ACE5E6_06600 [Phycisphaerae bacterium]
MIPPRAGASAPAKLGVPRTLADAGDAVRSDVGAAMFDDADNAAPGRCCAWYASLGVMSLSLLLGFSPIPRDPDLWFHLADGRHILATGAVPDTDPFSMTRVGAPWVPQSWLFDVGVAAAWANVSPRALEAVMAVAFAATIMLSLALLLGRGVSPVTAAIICAAIALAAHTSRGVRPQVLSLLACNVVIYVLFRHDRVGPRLRGLVLLPPMFLLWAQVHSACVLGLIVACAWLGGRAADLAEDGTAPTTPEHGRPGSGVAGAGRLAPALVAIVVSAGAILVTPHRSTHFGYVAQTIGLSHLGRVLEWQAPRALTLSAPHVYVYVLLAGIMLLLARRGRQAGWAEIGVCVGLIVLGLSAIRHVPLACIGSVPLLGELLGAPRDASAVGRSGWAGFVGRRWWRSVVATAACAVVVLAAPWGRSGAAADRYARYEPVHGAAALASSGRAWRVFTTYNTGSYVLYAGGPRVKVFVDSRADVYGDELLDAAYRARAGVGWAQLFATWRIDAAVVERADALASILADDADWILAAEDTRTLTFQKR